MVLAHRVYIEAIAAYLAKGGGSRGSSLVTAARAEEETAVHPLLEKWRIVPENPALKEQIQLARWNSESGTCSTRWTAVRPVPEGEFWSETVWARYLDRSVFGC